MSYFSTADSYEKVYLSICEALDCGSGDLMTAGKVECIPAKKESPDA